MASEFPDCKALRSLLKCLKLRAQSLKIRGEVFGGCKV